MATIDYIKKQSQLLEKRRVSVSEVLCHLDVSRSGYKDGETITVKTIGNYIWEMGLLAHWLNPYTQTTIDSDFSDSLKNILDE